MTDTSSDDGFGGVFDSESSNKVFSDNEEEK